jgi:polysaccharide biosynthesis/export protein
MPSSTVMGRLLVLAAFLVSSLAAAPVDAQPQADDSYVIGPEDVLEVQVWDNKDLNHVVFVRPDGKTSLPLLGEIQAGGKSVIKLQQDLTELYSKTVRQPLVTIIIREIKSRPVYFIGGFARPGAIQLLRKMTLLQATVSVGGAGPTGDGEKGFVLRGDKRIPVDFRKLLEKADLSQDMQILPGDSVVIPVADLVYIQGEVRAPGAVKYTADLTIVKAVTQAGGFTPLAASGRVDILRNEGEKRTRIRVDLDKMLRAPEENPDMRLRPEDVIFVPQRLF